MLQTEHDEVFEGEWYYEELMKTSKIATRVGPLWKHKSKEFPKNIENVVQTKTYMHT